MAITSFLPINKQHVVISVVAVLLIISSVFVISMSLQAAYLWLLVVLIILLFFTTFTCSTNANWQRNTGLADNPLGETAATDNTQPCWVIDLPPSYRIATGLPSGQTPPPCYKKLKFPPPSYNDFDSKSEIITDVEFKGSLKTAISGTQSEVVSNQQFQQNSVQSAQTLNLNTCESY